MRASVLVLGPAGGALGPGPGLAPRRLRHRRPPHRPAPEGAHGARAPSSRLEHGYVEGRVPGGRLRGTIFTFDKETVTGTENVMMAAALAEGRTVLENCAREPEVVDLAAALVRMGARIEGAGTAPDPHRRGRVAPPARPRRHPRPDRGRHLPRGRRAARQRRHRRGLPGRITSSRWSRSCARPAPRCRRCRAGCAWWATGASPPGGRPHRAVPGLRHRHAGPDDGIARASPTGRRS